MLKMTWFSKEGKLSREDVLELTRQAAAEALKEFAANRKKFCFCRRILLVLTAVQVGLQRNSIRLFLKTLMYM